MAKWQFIMFYVFFLSFVLFFISVSPLPEIVYSGANLTATPPVCNIGGWTAIFDAVACGVGYIVYFFGFMSISVAEGYGWLWTLLFAPFIITLAWVIAEFIRGSD